MQKSVIEPKTTKPVIFRVTKNYQKGKEVTISDLRQMSEKKELVYVVSNYGEDIMYPYELLSWQVRSILNVKMFKAELK